MKKHIYLLFLLLQGSLIFTAQAQECDRTLEQLLSQMPHIAEGLSPTGKKSLSELKAMSLPRSVEKNIAHLMDTQKSPKILMAATEFGTLTLQGQEVTAKVGGLAVVVNDMIKLLPDFLKRQGNGEVGFVFMGYEGLPRGHYQTSFDINIDGNIHKVDLYEEVLDNGAKIFVLDNEVFLRRSLINNDRNLYVNDPDLPLLSGRIEWEEAYILSLYNQAIARTHQWYGSNIYHAHDAGTLLATKFIDKQTSSMVTIHNAGPGYQGVYWTGNYGHGRDFYQGVYSQGVPVGDYQSNDKLLRILGFSFDEYMRLTEDHGIFNTFKLTRDLEMNNGIAGIPVSDGYSRELGMSRDDIISSIWLQKNAAPVDINAIYLPNDNKQFGLLDGIENGLGDKARPTLGNHPFVQKKTEQELEKIHPAIVDPEIRNLWLKGLTYGDNLDTEQGIARVHEVKAILKESLQKTMGLEVDSERPVFSTMARIVDQKNVGVFVENVRHIIHQGGQVVIAGQPGDPSGIRVANRMEEILSQLSPDERKHVAFYKGFANKELGLLIQGGADYFVITSKFEPCGLTDIEASWLGTVVLSRRTGGLGKVKNGLYYDWTDSSDHGGEIAEAGRLMTEAIELFKNDRERFQNLRIGAMREDFSWDIALAKYIENYRSIGLFKVSKSLFIEAQSGRLTFPKAVEIMNKVLSLTPVEARENFIRILKKRTAHNLIEKHVIEKFEDFGRWKGLAEATHHKDLGAVKTENGYTFRVWIPAAEKVELITDRRGWGKPITLEQDKDGIWSVEVRDISDGDKYKYRIYQGDNFVTERTDPVSKFVSQGDGNHWRWRELGGGPWHSVIYESSHIWSDAGFVIPKKPRFMEIHPGTVIPGNDKANWKEIADYIIPILKESKTNFIQLMPTSHHNVHESWGYQVGSIFSPNYRHGTPDDLKYLVNKLHQNGIGVSFDLVLGHMSRDTDTGISMMGRAGSALYEKSGYMGDHPDWGTKIADFSKKTTRDYYLSFGKNLIEEFHIDAYRVDGVSSMTFLNYSRGEHYERAVDGGHLDYDAVRFLQEFNSEMHELKPGIIAIAEDSHGFHGVTKPLDEGGLGFDFKWEMGGMYMMRKFARTHENERDVKDLYKAIEWHPEIWNENQIHYVNNHDESSNPGKYFLDTINGLLSEDEQLDWGRAFQGHFSITMPGRSLNFMGDEFANKGDAVKGGWGHWWDQNTSPNTHLKDKELHQKYASYFSEIGRIIENEPALDRVDAKSIDVMLLDDFGDVGVAARYSEGYNHDDTLITVFNASNKLHEEYRIPVPFDGEWRVILNSDDERFGGKSLQLNKSHVEDVPVHFEGKTYDKSIRLRLPRRSFLILKK